MTMSEVKRYRATGEMKECAWLSGCYVHIEDYAALEARLQKMREVLDKKYRAPLDDDKNWQRGVLVGVAMVKASLRKALADSPLPEETDET
jgi:hypothetical protein